MLAATFGNVHGVYKPGNVKLRPAILKDGQDVVGAKFGLPAAKPFDLVFHGGSGSTLEEIREALDYGVVKMNVDTDTQYAFTRPIADHMFSNYDGVLKVDGEVGNKKEYDPRARQAAEAGMAARVVEACEDLRSAGQSARRAMTHAPRQPAGRAAARRCCRRTGADASWPRATPPAEVAAGTRRHRWPGRPSPRRRWTGRTAVSGHDRGLRVRPHRLPPRPGRAAPQRLEGPRPGAVVARAQPRLPALRDRAGAGRGGDRRGTTRRSAAPSSCATATRRLAP